MPVSQPMPVSQHWASRRCSAWRPRSAAGARRPRTASRISSGSHRTWHGTLRHSSLRESSCDAARPCARTRRSASRRTSRGTRCGGDYARAAGLELRRRPDDAKTPPARLFFADARAMPDRVAASAAADACVLVVDGRALDVTAFLDQHPGGGELLTEFRGRDASLAFDEVGHSFFARAMLDAYVVFAPERFVGGRLPPRRRNRSAGDERRTLRGRARSRKTGAPMLERARARPASRGRCAASAVETTAGDDGARSRPRAARQRARRRNRGWRESHRATRGVRQPEPPNPRPAAATARGPWRHPPDRSRAPRRPAAAIPVPARGRGRAAPRPDSWSPDSEK